MKNAAALKSRIKVRAPVAANDTGGIAAGTLYVAPDGEVLMLRRSAGEENYPGHWALPGGKADDGETAEQAARRESAEEMGSSPEGKLKLLSKKTTPTGMTFHTFAQPVAEKFQPKLNVEHSGYAWSRLNDLPKPLHPAVKATIDQALGRDCAADMSPEDWSGLVKGFLKFISEEEREPEHAEDVNFEESVHPRAENGQFSSGGGGSSGRAAKVSPSELSDNLQAKYPGIKLDIGGSGDIVTLSRIVVPKDGRNNGVGSKVMNEIVNWADSHGKTVALSPSTDFGGNKGRLSEFYKRFGFVENKGKNKNFSTRETMVRTPKKHAADVRNPSGALTEAERAEADRNHASREEMPASAFLDPGERKYPVRERRDGEWKYSRNLLLAAAREARMHGHEELAARADKIRNGMAQDHDLFALDSAPENRTETEDGHMQVKFSNISKAAVNPYLGEEIPGWQELGLDPKKIYKLYRHPTELKKGAATLSEKPLLMVHKPSTADDHPREVVVGTLGSKPKVDGKYLTSSLTIWDGEGVDAVKSGKQVQISAGYHYDPDMTPGVTPDGEPFDGVMRNLRFNHAALVEEGRAGPDCMVGDENPFKTAGSSGDTVKELNMTVKKTRLSPMAAAAKGAIVAHIRPQLATDAKVDFGALVKGVTKKGWAADRARILKALPAAIKGKGPKLATDAEVGPIVAQIEKLLDTINPAEEGMDDDPDMGGEDEENKPKWTDEDQKAYDEMCEKRSKAGAMDEDEETEEERKARMEKRAMDKAAKDAELEAGKTALDTEEEKPVTKAAMDARLAKMAKDNAAEIARVRQATIQQMRDTADALNQVKPLVGEIAIACDTALDVYTHTMKQLGIASDGLPAAAMKVIIERELSHQGADRASSSSASLAFDSNQVTELDSWKAANGISQRKTSGA